MTSNYHTPLVDPFNLQASNFNAPLGQLDSQITTSAGVITNLKSGATSFDQINLGAPTTLNIVGGAITITRSRHIIDTEGGAATDNLDTINGGTDGDMLRLQIANDARVVTLRFSAGNIVPGSGTNMTLASTNKVVDLIYDGASGLWIQQMGQFAIREPATITANPQTLRVPRNTVKTGTAYYGADATSPFVALLPDLGERHVIGLMASNVLMQPIGVLAPTVYGTPTNANQTDGSYIQYATGASAGSLAGVASTTFNLLRPQYNPVMTVIVRTGALITSQRIWIGMTGALIASTDNIGGAGIPGLAFRYSTDAGDTNWKYIFSDGATQNVSDSGIAVTANTTYKLMIAPAASGSLSLNMSVDGNNPLSGSGPALAEELGFNIRVEARAASARHLLIKRLYASCD